MSNYIGSHCDRGGDSNNLSVAVKFEAPHGETIDSSCAWTMHETQPHDRAYY